LSTEPVCPEVAIAAGSGILLTMARIVDKKEDNDTSTPNFLMILCSDAKVIIQKCAAKKNEKCCSFNTKYAERGKATNGKL
jgi:hypothetical protein